MKYPRRLPKAYREKTPFELQTAIVEMFDDAQEMRDDAQELEKIIADQRRTVAALRAQNAILKRELTKRTRVFFDYVAARLKHMELK